VDATESDAGMPHNQVYCSTDLGKSKFCGSFFIPICAGCRLGMVISMEHRSDTPSGDPTSAPVITETSEQVTSTPLDHSVESPPQKFDPEADEKAYSLADIQALISQCLERQGNDCLEIERMLRWIKEHKLKEEKGEGYLGAGEYGYKHPQGV